MKAYRYNSERREDRDYNTTGNEKNPNWVKFYATNLEYAENYRFIYMKDGDVDYECSLEVVEIENVNLFDMASNFKSLNTFNSYVQAVIEIARKDFEHHLRYAKKESDKKLFTKFLNELNEKEPISIANRLKNNEFQSLSDFKFQTLLVSELKSLGFDGYFTNNEIALF